MEPDHSPYTLEGLSLECFDPSGNPSIAPDTLPSDEPLVYRPLNNQWWQHVRGQFGRKLWADAWEGTEAEKADAVQSTLQAIDMLQQEEHMLLKPFSWDFPNDPTDPTNLFTIYDGSWVSPNAYISGQIISSTRVRLTVEADTAHLLSRIEVDAVWETVSTFTSAYWRVFNGGSLVYEEVLGHPGDETLVYQLPGATIEEQLTYFDTLTMLLVMDCSNTALPWEIKWHGVRLFGYGNPPA